MKILGLRVDGFGNLCDLSVDDLSPGLSVVWGPNEAGKSTLLDFVRAMLFGFPDRRSRAPGREPLRGGRYGGMLRLLDDQGVEWVVERHADTRAAILTASDGRNGGEAELRRLLGHADAGVFASVFAFGLSELSSLATLEADEVRDLIFTAGVLGAGRSATRAVQALESRRAALVRPRADARANDLRKRLDDAERALRERRDAAQGFPAREAELRRYEEQKTTAHADRLDSGRRLRDLDRLLACRPSANRIAEAKERLERLAVSSPSEEALLERAPQIRRLVEERSAHAVRSENLAKLGSQLDGVLDNEAKAADELGRLLEDDEDGPEPRPDVELRELGRSIQTLRGLISQRDQLVAARAQKEALALSARSTRSAGSRLLVGMLAVACVASIVVAAGAFARHQAALGAGAAAVALVLAIAVWLSGQGSKSPASVVNADHPGTVDPARLATDIAQLSRRFGLADAPLLAEVDGAALAIDVERDRRESFDERARRLAEIDDELERLGAAKGRVVAAIDRERQALMEFEREVTEVADAARLAGDGPAVDISARLASSLDAAQQDETARRALEATIDQARSDLAAVVGAGPETDRLLAALVDADDGELEVEREQVSLQMEEAEAAWQQARDAEVEARRSLEELASSSEVADLELAVASLRSELDTTFREWLTLGVAARMLTSTIDRYEKERQPEVIHRASELFSLVTAGRYVRLVAREEGDRASRHGVIAVSEGGHQVDSGALSRGTQEQLYLCLRLALAAAHAERTVALPFVLDDVLVNFDPGRAGAVAAAIGQTAASHQVLAFTCHPHIVDLFAATTPECAVISLPLAG